MPATELASLAVKLWIGRVAGHRGMTMRKAVVAFISGEHRGSITVDCPGLPPAPPSLEEFREAARLGMIAAGRLTEQEAALAKYVVQD